MFLAFKRPHLKYVQRANGPKNQPLIGQTIFITFMICGCLMTSAIIIEELTKPIPSAIHEISTNIQTHHKKILFAYTPIIYIYSHYLDIRYLFQLSPILT